MEELGLELLKQVPALAVLAFIVIQFLRYLEKKECNLQDMLTRIGDTCHQVQRETTERTAEALAETRATIGENSKVLGEVGAVLRRMNGG